MKARVFSAILIVFLAALACNMPTWNQVTATATPSRPEAVLTEVAATVSARLTQPPAPPATSVAGQPATQIPTATLTMIPPPTNNPSTPTTRPCDMASFGQDVTIPDGTKLNPGTAFTKTWRLKNIADCTWTRSYAVVFVSGESMGAPAVVNLPGEVPPNATVDISVDMRAPNNPGKYVGYWKLRNAAGTQFGIGGDQPFYVMIEVASVTPTVTVTGTPTITSTYTVTPTLTPTPTNTQVTGLVYDFTKNLCQADWLSQAGALPCPGIIGDRKGFADRARGPKLENGQAEGNPVILAHPNDDENGAITGQYPAITIEAGYHFQSGLSCQYGQTSCSVIFQLNFVSGGSQPVRLGQWTRTYNGSPEYVDIDLSSLAGQQVQIVLAVLANGSPNQDDALWVYPRIVKK